MSGLNVSFVYSVMYRAATTLAALRGFYYVARNWCKSAALCGFWSDLRGYGFRYCAYVLNNLAGANNPGFLFAYFLNQFSKYGAKVKKRVIKWL